ncbi:alpha/beta hydrolase [Neoaquamicrobium sediminum]|uniref:alpha/beta hydrolase n=1 Tax=Neoaquamicrobium sediminum TaxID=1849104 RepID=UPI0035E413D6
MPNSTPEYLSVDGDRIAVRHRNGKTPGIVWLGGYRSDMLGTKAETLDQWAAEHGHAFTRHDYSGHGESGGAFADGTISRWLAQSLTVFRQRTVGPQILVGSSMGAWIALRIVQELHKAGEGGARRRHAASGAGARFHGRADGAAAGRQPAPRSRGTRFFAEQSDYSPEPNIYTRALFEDGRANRVMVGLIDTHCPVHILQGMADPDVPYEHALKLVEHLPADDVTLSLVRDGDHRLSRPQDLSMMVAALEGLVERAAERS